MKPINPDLFPDYLQWDYFLSCFNHVVLQRCAVLCSHEYNIWGHIDKSSLIYMMSWRSEGHNSFLDQLLTWFSNTYMYIWPNRHRRATSLWLSDAKWCHLPWSALFQLMACHPFGDYLNQCRAFLNWTPRNKFQSKYTILYSAKWQQ